MSQFEIEELTEEDFDTIIKGLVWSSGLERWDVAYVSLRDYTWMSFIHVKFWDGKRFHIMRDELNRYFAFEYEEW